MVPRVSVNWYRGNATQDAPDHRGWLLGHFIDPAEGVRSSGDVEVKWGLHPAGETRAAWTTDEWRTTLVLLVSGHFRLDLTAAGVVLERQGDYAVWGPGIDHSWEAISDSIVITVRWPSAPGAPRQG
jgi:quercetin dioxygenase-like cupin family protein